jgi:hypothetical protein
MIKLLNILNEWAVRVPPKFKKGDYFTFDSDEDSEVSNEMQIIGNPVVGYDEASKRVNIHDDTAVLTVYVDDVYDDDDDTQKEKLERNGYFYPIRFLKGIDKIGRKMWIKGDYVSEAYILRDYFPHLES